MAPRRPSPLPVHGERVRVRGRPFRISHGEVWAGARLYPNGMRISVADSSR